MKNSEIKKSIANESDIQKINRYSRRELTCDEVYVFTATLCDNDIDRDYERFSLETLKELAPMFEGKTGIFDHSMKSSDQKARVFETYVEECAGEKCIDAQQKYCLKARAYMLRSDENKALIEEIDAGIKKEISVSCSIEKSVCSVCGSDTKKQMCSHRAGEYYDGNLCYRTLEGAADAYEFSFVAVPAQRKAGVTKSFTKEKTVDELINTIKSAKGEVALSKNEVKKIASYIDSLEEEAKLAEDYKNELKSEVTKLFKENLPVIDFGTLSSVVSVMTVKELLAFKKGLSSKESANKPQLLNEKNKNKKGDYSQFKI